MKGTYTHHPFITLVIAGVLLFLTALFLTNLVFSVDMKTKHDNFHSKEAIDKAVSGATIPLAFNLIVFIPLVLLGVYVIYKVVWHSSAKRYRDIVMDRNLSLKTGRYDHLSDKQLDDLYRDKQFQRNDSALSEITKEMERRLKMDMIRQADIDEPLFSNTNEEPVFYDIND